MDAYHLALFLHLLALFAASAASALTHLAEARLHRATTVREARQWHALAGSSARIFPIVIVLLLVTGGVMISQGGGVSWRTGWVAAGVVGVVLLFLNGGALGRRGGMLARELARQEAERSADAAPIVSHDPVAARLGWANTGIAIAVAFVMVVKTALAASLGVVALGAVLGAVIARPRRAVGVSEMERELAA